MAKTKTVKTAVADKIKATKKTTFNLESFKKSKNLSKNASFKEQEWIPLSPAFNEAISLPGIPHGHVVLFRGLSDTGKTAALVETAISCQNLNKLPVFIVTEMKWSWDRAIKMGLKVEVETDKSGDKTYSGNFIYVDRDSLNSIENVAEFMSDLLSEQKKGNLPYDLVFLWDSSGSIPCQQSLDSGKNNNLWNAGAMSTQFGNFINQQFPLSRKKGSKYTNTFVCISKQSVIPPIGEGPMAKPKRGNKGGNTMYFDATLVINFGNITNSGVSKIDARKNGKEVTFARRTNIAVEKNHITNSTTKSKIIMTEHGFIRDVPAEIEKYKNAHRHEWLNILGSKDFEVVEEEEIKESDKTTLSTLLENITEDEINVE